MQPQTTDGVDFDGEGEDFASFAVTVTRTDAHWHVREFDDDFDDLDTSVRAVRALRAEGPAFALLCVDDDYFIVVRPSPNRTRVLLSDATAGVEDAIAAAALEEIGAEVPDLNPDEVEDVDPWAEGDFDILADLGLSEQVMGLITDDLDDWASEQIVRIAEELGFDDELFDEVDIPEH